MKFPFICALSKSTPPVAAACGFAWGAAILAVAGIIWVVLVNMSKKDMAANDSPTAHVG